mmetsp:Transcript_13017/g.41119  ORF Transcript_13017/g.41119 Transcript_13017/m.41119 type:complete len:92 (+) Transcript_13017:19-294(+)
MKVTSISIFRHNGAGTDPTCLGAVSDLQNFGFFQRPAVREMLTFVSRTIVTRTEPGQRQSVEHEGARPRRMYCVTRAPPPAPDPTSDPRPS